MKGKRTEIRSGDTFGHWKVIKETKPAHSYGRVLRMMLCQCRCGERRTVRLNDLRNNKSRNCGCVRKESMTLHGMSSTAEYASWNAAKHRCYNPKTNSYKRYGGRGIVMCDEWKTDFNAFLRDMGKRPSPKHSIDRINNNGNYCKENCRWATVAEQQRNKHSVKMISACGKTMCLTAWEEYTGIKLVTLWRRLNILHWSPEKTFSTPVLRTWQRR